MAKMYLKQPISFKNDKFKTGSKTNGVIHSTGKEKRRTSVSFNKILSIACLVAIGSIVYWATGNHKE